MAAAAAAAESATTDGSTPSLGRRILNSTSIYNEKVSGVPVDEVNVVITDKGSARSQGPESQGPGSQGSGSQGQGSGSQQRQDKLEPTSSILMPTTRDFLDLLQTERCHVYPDDVWIVTYPKTGTTWMSEIVVQLLSECDDERVNKRRMELGKTKIIRLELYVGHGADAEQRLYALNALSRPRIICTHLPVQELPEKIFTMARVIVTVRDPKDSAVSYYHFHRMNKQLGQYKGDWHTFYEAYLTGEVFWGTWLDWHVPMVTKHANNAEHVLFVRFEDLKQDAVKEVRRVVHFLGLPHNEQLVADTVTRCGFTTMKKTVGDQFMAKFGILDFGISHFFRKGAVGDWKNHFTVAQSELYDELLRERLRDVPENVGALLLYY